MRYFLTVAETCNITAAARLLHMAQPPLSRQIKQIETELGICLFDRKGRSLHLTEAGKLLVNRVQEILNLTDRSLQEVRSFNSASFGILALGTVASASAVLLPKLLTDFQQNYPLTRYELYIGETIRITELLEKGVIEVGIVRPPFDKDIFSSFCLPEEKLVIIANDSYDLPKNKTVHISELATLPLLIHRKYETLLKKIFHKYHCKPNFLCKCDDIMPLMAWAKSGLGLAIIPESAALLVSASNLQIYYADDSDMATSSAIIWTKKHYHSHIANLFIDYLAKRF